MLKADEQSVFYFYFLNYENMITHLQEFWKIQNKVTYSSTITIIFWIDKLRFLVGVSISSSQRLIEWINRGVESYSWPEKLYEPIQHKIYTIYTEVGNKFYSSSQRL